MLANRPNRFNWTDELIRKAKQLREAGLTFDDIAQHIGVGKDTIRIKLLAVGAIAPRQVTPEPKEEMTPTHQGPRAPYPPGAPETWGLICLHKYPNPGR